MFIVYIIIYPQNPILIIKASIVVLRVYDVKACALKGTLGFRVLLRLPGFYGVYGLQGFRLI